VLDGIQGFGLKRIGGECFDRRDADAGKNFLQARIRTGPDGRSAFGVYTSMIK
jgi:hypothetical protein